MCVTVAIIRFVWGLVLYPQVITKVTLLKKYLYLDSGKIFMRDNFIKLAAFVCVILYLVH